MPGPPPKPAEQRRRRNKAPEVVKLASAPKRKRTPALGLRKPLKSTRTWWATIWASPMADVWLDADVHALARLAALIDEYGRGDVSGTLLAEMRQLEDRFGLSPMARRRLQWEIEQAAGGAPGVPERREEEDRWLRAVDSA